MSGNERPDVSVLMPVYNGEKFISESIESVLNQTFRNFELIIIDDCSEDQSAHIIKQYDDRRIKYFRNEKNLGQTLSLNKGIKLAKGNYIARIDQDDISDGRRLEHQLNFLESNPEYGLCGTLAKVIDATGIFFYKVSTDSNDPEYLKCKLFFENVIFHSSAFFSSRLAKKLLYDPSIKIAQDYDLWVKIVQNKKVGLINEYLVSLRKHGNNASEVLSEQTVMDIKKVLSHQLKRLDVDHNSDELELHYKMCTENLNLRDDFKLLDSWISKLVKKNIELKKYNSHYFEHFIIKKLVIALLKCSFRNRSIAIVFNGLVKYQNISLFKNFSLFRKVVYVVEFIWIDFLKKWKLLKYRVLNKPK